MDGRGIEHNTEPKDGTIKKKGKSIGFSEGDQESEAKGKKDLCS